MMATPVKKAVNLRFIGRSLHLECFCLIRFIDAKFLDPLQILEVRLMYLHLPDESV